MTVDLHAIRDRHAVAMTATTHDEGLCMLDASLADIPDLIARVEELQGLLAVHVADSHAYPYDEPGPGDSER